MTEQTEHYCEIALQAKLASTAAPDLYAQLADHRADMVVIDASKVEQIGTLCMQILVSAAQSWRQEDRAFEIIEPSPAFLSSIEAVDLAGSRIGLDESGSAEDGP